MTTTVAAIYARKSTQQEGGNGSTSESVERQIAHARDFIKKRGWKIGPEYHDDAVSGAEFAKLKNRERLIADAESGKFGIIVISEQSRLGRDMIEVVGTIRQLAWADVKVFTYLHGEEIHVENETQQIMAVLQGFASASERRGASERTRDALRRRAVGGYVAGSKLFGYTNVRGDNGFVTRVINETEAKTVRRIFARYVDGDGVKIIARRLNDDHVPASRPKGWSQGGILAMLKNTHYHGVVMWGQRRTEVRKGRTVIKPAPESAHVRTEQPHLRIVTEKVWNAVPARLDRARAAYPRAVGGRLLGRPALADSAKYALTGFAVCSACGGSIRATSRQQGQARGQRRHAYCCAVRETRGTCGNAVTVEYTLLEHAVLDSIARALDPRILTAAVDKALTRIQAHESKHESRRDYVAKELKAIGSEERKWLAAIRLGKPPKALVAELNRLEARRTALEAEAATQENVTPIDGARLKKKLTEQVGDVVRLMGENPMRTRQMLRKILAGPITCTPIREQRGGRSVRGFRFAGTLALGRLIEGDVLTRASVTSGAGC